MGFRRISGASCEPPALVERSQVLFTPALDCQIYADLQIKRTTPRLLPVMLVIFLLLTESPEQLSRGDIEAQSQNFDCPEARLLLASFKLRYVNAPQSRVLSKVHLRPTALLPQLPNAPAKPHANVACHLMSMALSFRLSLASRLSQAETEWVNNGMTHKGEGYEKLFICRIGTFDDPDGARTIFHTGLHASTRPEYLYCTRRKEYLEQPCPNIWVVGWCASGNSRSFAGAASLPPQSPS